MHIFVSHSYIQSSFGQNTQLEYRVQAGDSHLFQYTKFYDTRLIDPFKDYRVYTDINGTLVNVSISEGTFLKYTITDLIDNNRYRVQVKINNNVTYSENRSDNFIVRPTSDKASLENYFEDINWVTIEDKYLIERFNDSSFLGDDGIYYFLNRYIMSKWDINTGWLLSSYFLVYDDEGTVYYETEIISRSTVYTADK